MNVDAPADPPTTTMRDRPRPRRRQALLGWVYATPTTIFVISFGQSSSAQAESDPTRCVRFPFR